MTQEIYTRDTLYSVVWNDYLQYNPCEDAVKYFTYQLGRNPNLTYGEVMDDYLAVHNANLYPDANKWGLWGWLLTYDHSDETIRLQLLSKLADNSWDIDYMSCLGVYRDHYEELYESEKQFLISIFQGQLPTAEQELRDLGIYP